MNINDIYAAKTRLAPYLSPTPLLYSHRLEKQLNKSIWLKLETQQPTGSFKPRPAFNSILSQLEAARARGVIASSSGNFAQAVAYAARELGVSALIVMAEKTSPYKIQRTKDFGAEVVLCGNQYEDRIETTRKLQAETNRVFLHPYDADTTIAGDGTLSLELDEQLGKELDDDMSILVPVSGGGLVAGIAFTMKTLHPHCKIIGVQPKNCSSLTKSLAAGKCINVGLVTTIADALGSSQLGEHAFALIQHYLDDVILIDETAINDTTRWMIEDHKLVVEPGGAIGIAALLTHQVKTKKCVCVVSGGNIQLFKE